MTDLKKLVGMKISEYRKIRGMTQAKLAEQTELSNDFISRVERGERIPSIETLSSITKTLGISLKEIFDFSETQQREKFSVESERVTTYLKSKNEKEIRLAYNVIKAVFETLKDNT